MFTVSRAPTFTHEVDITVPVDGGSERVKLKTRFRVKSLDELASLEREGETQLFAAVVDRFEDLADDEGKPVDCTDKVKEQILGYAFVRTGIRQAFMAAMLGAERKN